MKIITSIDDGHMKRFAEYETHKGLGFQGYERMLYLSLVAALEKVDKITDAAKTCDPDMVLEVLHETDDKSTG
jgi:hypothetical protein